MFYNGKISVSLSPNLIFYTFFILFRFVIDFSLIYWLTLLLAKCFPSHTSHIVFTLISQCRILAHLHVFNGYIFFPFLLGKFSDSKIRFMPLAEHSFRHLFESVLGQPKGGGGGEKRIDLKLLKKSEILFRIDSVFFRFNHFVDFLLF